MNVNNLKTGQSFSARVDNNKKIEGHIFILDMGNGKWLFLCQEYKEGLISPYMLGYTHSYVLCLGTDGCILNTGPFNNLRFGNKPNPNEPSIEITEMSINGYSISKKEDNYIFGCGEVVLKQEDIRTFARIYNIIKLKSIDMDSTFSEIVNRL